LVVSLELQAELIVENPQIAVASACDCFWHDRFHVLRYHPDIGPFAAVINEAVEADAVVEAAKEDDVVFKI
jgi:hypothetical protein